LAESGKLRGLKSFIRALQHELKVGWGQVHALGVKLGRAARGGSCRGGWLGLLWLCLLDGSLHHLELGLHLFNFVSETVVLRVQKAEAVREPDNL
jgi:hypothetical protein